MPVITTIAAIASTAAINASLAVGLGGLAWTIGSAVSFAVPLALTVGLSYAAQSLSKTQTGSIGGGALTTADSPAAINTPEARGNVKQNVPAQRVPMGKVRTGGAMFLYEVKPPYLYIGFLYSTLPVAEFSELYVGERKLTFSGPPAENTIVSPLDVGGEPDFPNRLSVCVQHGSLGTTQNAIIAADLASDGTVDLGSYFITPGVACCVFKCHYGSDADEFLSLWGNVQIPNFQWVLKGVGLPDPRVPSCILDFDPYDPAELYAAAATWPYSDNSSLAHGFWAAMPFGLGAGPSRIDYDRLTMSADFDDEVVPLNDGGTQKRYVVSCLATLKDKPNVVMEALMTANRGFLSQRQGKVHVFSSQPREPRMTITDAMLTGSFQFRRIKPKKDLVNIASCTYVSPDSEWQDEDGPVLRRESLITSDGEELEQKVRLSVTPTHQRAQRLIKGFVDHARLERHIALRCSMRAYGLREGDIVRRYSETGRYSSQDGLYSVEEWQLAADRTGVALSLSEYDPDIERDWIASRDELPFIRLEAA